MIREYKRVLAGFTRELVQHRYLIRAMVLRDLKARYIGSTFGLFWAIANPLLMLAIYGLVFGLLFKGRSAHSYAPTPYFVFMFSGLVPWLFFAETLQASTSSIRSNSNLVKRAVGFPSELLPIITVLSNGVSHIVAIGIVMISVLIFAEQGLTIYSITVGIYTALLLIFTIGLAWTLASLNVYLRDVQQVLSPIIRGWFFLTPIVYSVDIVPKRFQPLYKLNPMYDVIEGYRHALLGVGILPVKDIAYLAIIAVLVFGIGGYIFRKLKFQFVDVL